MSWELLYRTLDGELTSRHSNRDDAISVLTEYLVDEGVSVLNDSTAPERLAIQAGFSATIDAPDGTQIFYSIRHIKDPIRYLSLAQVAEAIGVQPSSLSRYKLPEPDATVGFVDPNGLIARGTTRGWLPETIDQWNANRPGRGARTDLND